MSAHQPDNRVARQFLGYFTDGDYKEIIQIEYRYEPRGRVDLHTRIRGELYRIVDSRFFNALSELLDQLPKSSAIIIPHYILVRQGTAEEIAMLEEWLSPFEEPTGGTVVYQLKLVIGDRHIETSRRTSAGYLVIDFRSAMNDLRYRLDNDVSLKVCFFCKYLIDYNTSGGTDYRHDQLYCFRDSLETFNEITEIYPKLRGHESLLLNGTPDMDALHSCSSFVDKE